MSDKAKGLLPKWLQDGFVNLLTPFVNLLTKWDINPNTFTVWGLIITSLAAIALVTDRSFVQLAGILILLGGICDILDGKLARYAGKATKFGALFDSSIDRYSEVIMYFGIAAFYVRADDYMLSVMTFIALGGSMMVSYVRARAEGLGFEAKVGFMQRPERVVAIGAGALFYFPLFHISIFHVTDFPVTLLDIMIWIVAIFSNITAIQRMMYVRKMDMPESKKQSAK
ncbi:MAG: CDP-alcohol phosphatidyltransferase family protein [Caldithrix sp.]|nr:CDP-alcohol phosphatidyltransferase family protein [Caldithrix sp.]